MNKKRKGRSEEQRQSVRVLLRIPIRVLGESSAGQPVDEVAETLAVSRHGALVKTTTGLRPDSKVRVENPDNHQSATFRVVWTKAKPLDGVWHAGLELMVGKPTLWGIKFPFE